MGCNSFRRERGHHPGVPRGRTSPAPSTTGPTCDAGDVVYFRQPLASPGVVRVVSTYDGKLKFSILRNGEPAGGMAFRQLERQIVARAVALAGASDEIASVATVPLKSGASIEIGAGCGRVYFRTVLPGGEKKRSTIISGPELEAVARALADLGVSP